MSPTLVHAEGPWHLNATLSIATDLHYTLVAVGAPSAATFLVVIILLVLGVVYPAVWSTCPERRSAAQRVLNRLLRAFFPKRR